MNIFDGARKKKEFDVIDYTKLEIEPPVIVNIRKGESCDIVIMRGSNRGNGSLANGYQIGVDGDRTEVIRKYAYDFRLKWRIEPEFRKNILACSGKRLGCCCKPERCHGDIIRGFLIELSTNGESAACSFLFDIASDQELETG